jgi:biotin carboxylase
MKKILVINLGWEQEPLLDNLEKYDVEIYGIHNNKNYYKNPKYRDILITDFRDLKAILNYAKSKNVDAVISDECDYSYFAQAVVAENLNLPGPRIREAQIATNKYLQRQKAKENGILIPEFKLVTSVKDIYKFIENENFPIIIKPVDNRGSFGINKVSSKSGIQEAFIDALINSHSRLVIVEKFIEGIHITVDGYAFKKHGIKSLAVADKKLSSNPNRQVALEIQYPATFNPDIYAQILKTNEIANKALGYEFGMIHSEYMVTKDDKIYLIESANRGGGVYTSEIVVPNVSGINILEQYICDTLNLNKDFFSAKIEKNKTILKFFNLNPGKIKSINGIEEILKKEEILKIRMAANAGDIVSEITTDADRHGFIIAKNKQIDINEMISKYIKVCYEK